VDIFNKVVTTEATRFVTDFDWESLVDHAIHLHRRAAQHSAAYVVSALNAALPADRVPWTPETLASFIAAFANVVEDQAADDKVTVMRVVEPDVIVGYLTRGTSLPPEKDQALRSMLLEECDETFDTLRHVHKYVREGTAAPATASENDASAPPAAAAPASSESTAASGAPSGNADLSARKSRFPALGLAAAAAGRARSLLGRAGSIVGGAGELIVAERRKLLERQIAGLQAKALIQGGLSTRECRDVLALHGLHETDIDAALQAGIESAKENKPRG